MYNMVQIKAEISRELKRQLLMALAAREEKFGPWLRAHLASWLREEANSAASMPEEASSKDARPVGAATRC
jgi:hypothetical protein